MAGGVAAEAIGEALFDIMQHAADNLPEHVDRAVSWLRENAEPPDGVKLSSPDGAEYTGIAIVHSNKVVALIAASHVPPAVPRPAYSPAYSPPTPAPAPSTSRRYLDPDDCGDGWPPNDPFLRR